MASFGSLKQAIFDKEARKQQYQDHIRGLNAYDRHKKFVDDYVSYYGKQKSVPGKLPVKTDLDTLREGYRFIRTEEDDMNPSWEQRLVKRYYDKLFKEGHTILSCDPLALDARNNLYVFNTLRTSSKIKEE